MAIKISFCIPTLNRGAFIGATLESIISQATDSIEIVIVDGGSTDNTPEIVRQYQKIFPGLRYFQTKASDAETTTAKPSNAGFDQDCNRAVELAQGEYCWLFTDDDLLMPGAISTVLNEIPKGYSLIILDTQVVNKDLSKVLENKRLPINKNEIYDESKLEQLFHRVIQHISFVGCVVIRRDLWMQREKARYYGTGFIHIGVIFQAPLPAPALVVAEPYIVIRFGNAQWTARAFEIWMRRWPNLLGSFEHISEQGRQEYLKIQSWKKLKNIITWRAVGVYSLEEYRKYLASENSSLWWRAVVLFVAITPACLVNLLMISYFKIIKKDLLSVDDLKNNKNYIMNIVRRKNLQQPHK
jgi:abequosyltransferase